ncbi:MAG TPA: DUF6356 family protein [Alphaproteobacteria bacterium]|nr:DUF6356 family protein [Alphaproteobacteria bacterium]
MFAKLFLEHPRSVGESYFQHLAMAASFSGRLLLASAACLVHALVPGLCVRTGSNAIRELHERMVVNRQAASGTRRDSATRLPIAG